jgi:phosphocarrier protein
LTEQIVTVKNKLGLHARPASQFIKTASKFKSTIKVKKGENTASAKSITNILLLEIKMNDDITISADGVDEKKAVKALVELINSKFGEE